MLGRCRELNTKIWFYPPKALIKVTELTTVKKICICELTFRGSAPRQSEV